MSRLFSNTNAHFFFNLSIGKDASSSTASGVKSKSLDTDLNEKKAIVMSQEFEQILTTTFENFQSLNIQFVKFTAIS